MANTKITTNVIADDAITSAKIADDAITSALIADDAITSALIADDAVGADQLASSAVVTASIVDDAVTGAKIENAVTIATSVTSPLVDGQNFKVNGGQGSDGQVLTSTGSGVAWEDAAGGVAGISSSADATAITIDSSERVGIGTTSPSTLLHLSNASNPAIRITDTTNTLNIEITATDTVGYFGTESNHATAFITNNTERIRIDTSGLVGIGRTPSSSTGSMLQVEGNDGIAMRRPSQTNNFTLRPNASTDGMRFTQEGVGDRMFIDSSGHVGIGATPSTTGFGGTFKYLGVQGGSGYGVFNGQTTSTSVNAGAASFFGSTVGTAGFALLGGMQVVNIASSASNAEGGLLFYTGSGGSIPERMRIDNSGRVSIGTTSALGNLTIGGNSSSARVLPATDNVGYIGESVHRWQAIYAVTGSIQTSDEREKTEIKETTLGLNFIKDLKPVSYKWIDGEQQNKGKDEREHQGLIAQQVAETVEKHGVNKNDFGGLDIQKTEKYEDFHGMSYNQFVAPLIKAIQEQQAVIEDLKTRIETLEG